MTLTDDKIWELHIENEDYIAFAHVIIAARDEELRKQTPVAWIHPNIDYRLVSLVRWSDDCLPLYAAPMPLAHNNHPARHWDMTCPACIAEGGKT